MGKRGTRWTSNVYEIFVIGEQLRRQMHDQGQIKDRRHHLRKFKQCFSGRDVIDWLVKTHHVKSRKEAVTAMLILQQNGLFHHVTDEQEFKDQNILYRFSFDDDTYKLNLDLASFYWGLNVYRKLKTSKEDVMQDFYLRGSLYSQAFLGCDLVDFIAVAEAEENREVVIAGLRDLLERDIIKHVTDDYHFSDDKLIYEFSLDFDKPCFLQDVVELVVHRKISDSTASYKSLEVELTKVLTDTTSPVEAKVAKKINVPSPDTMEETTPSDSSKGPVSCPKDVNNIKISTSYFFKAPVKFPQVTVQELEDPSSPFLRSSLKITRDLKGHGFVLCGSSPCYVLSMDPLGPAAAAGLKVGHVLVSVNGQDVLRMDHRQVGLLAAQSQVLNLTVLTYRCNNGKE